MTMLDVANVPDSREVIAPSGIVDIIRKLPEYKEWEMDVIQEQIADIDKRKALAGQITKYIREEYGMYQPEQDDIVESSVLKQLEDLDHVLAMEEQEAIRKAELFEDIEKDPEKKSLLSKAISAVKNGWEKVKQHKWKILIALGLLAGGVLGWYYWDYLAMLFSWGSGGAEAVSQEEAVATAIKGVEAAEAANTAQLSIVDHSIFFNGAEYVVKNPADMEALKSVLQTAVQENPDLIGNIHIHGSARASAEIGLHNILRELNIDTVNRLAPLLEDTVPK